MEDIVAIKVTDAAGKSHYFITWGRLFGPVDPEPLLKAITPHLPMYGIKNFTHIKLCPTLREASGQLYFYETLFKFSRRKIPWKNYKKYERWCKKQKKRIQHGKEIFYLGKE